MAQTLKHDAQGFLQGDPADLGRLVAVLADIRNDVRSLRQAVIGGKVGVKDAGKPVTSSAPSGSVVVPSRHGATPTRGASAGLHQPAAQLKSRALSLHAPLFAATPKQNQAGQPSRATNGLKSVGKAATVQQDATRVISPQGRGVRDDRGRFTAGAKSRQAVFTQDREDKDRDYDDALLRSVGARVADAVKETSAGLEEADPAVKAMNEVVQPLMRGFNFLTGGDRHKKQERWFRRIWQTLSGSRKEQGIFNKIAAKRLKAIEEKPGSEGGGGGFLSGLLGIFGALFSKIPGLKHLLPAAAALKAGSAVAGAGAGATKTGTAKAGRFGRMGKLLRRVPILGALIGGANMAADLYGSETDATLTREQKDRRAGKSVGGFAGSMAGMVGGAKLGALAGAVGGPIGAAIGGVVGGAVGLFLGDEAGQIIGDKMGGWVSALRQADIPGMISRAWEGAVNFVKSAWGEVKAVALGAWDWVKSGWDTVKAAGLDAWDWMKSGWEGVTGAISSGWESLKDGIKSAFDSTLAALDKGWQATKDVAHATKEFVADKAEAANAVIRDATGIDVKENAQQALSYVGDAASTAGDAIVGAGRAVTDKATAVKDKTVELGTQAADAVGRGANSAWEGAKSAGNWVLGQTAQLFESGKGGAGTVSSGKGDYGGASYGTYQLSSTQGTLQRFLAQSKYGAQFAGLKPGSREFNAKWKEVAQSDPEFGNAQHDFIKQTHYDPAMNGLKGFGIDLSGRGAAVQDAVWSSSTQFGAGNGKRGAIGMFRKALAGRDIATMSDKDIVTAVQDYKIANNDRLFASSNAKTRAGTARRAVAEKERLIALAEQSERQDVAGLGTPLAQQSQAPEPKVPVGIAAPTAPVVASVNVPVAPAAPIAQTVSEAPSLAVPLAGNDANRPAPVVTLASDVGQDVRERGIAHIVTGGLNGGSG